MLEKELMKNVSLCVTKLFLRLTVLLMNMKRNSDLKWVIIMEFVKTIIWNGSHHLKNLIEYHGCYWIVFQHRNKKRIVMDDYDLFCQWMTWKKEKKLRCNTILNNGKVSYAVKMVLRDSTKQIWRAVLRIVNYASTCLVYQLIMLMLSICSH